MRYMPTSVKLSEESYGVHNIYLCRGKDKAGNRYGDPNKSYDELARFRRRSATDTEVFSQSVAMSHTGSWQAYLLELLERLLPLCKMCLRRQRYLPLA